MHHTRYQAFRARFALSPVALVVASLLQPVAGHAQPGEPAPRLKPSPTQCEWGKPRQRKGHSFRLS